jgi:selenocysteine lyase/cysteine desulfurase
MNNIDTLRADTPGVRNRIHLNNAGAALPPWSVTDTILQHLRLESEIGGYEAADAATEAMAGFYASVARLINAQPRNIAFTASATDAYARALSAIPLRKGDVILTTENDYVSNQLAFLSLQERMGIQLVRVRDTAEGGLDPEDMERLIRTMNPALVAVTHVPTSSGLVQPVEAVGRLCREYGCWYLVDACQSAGQIPLDVEAIGCDFLTATMRKYLRGPRGAGFLYASDRVLDAGLNLLYPDLVGSTWTAPDTFLPNVDATRFEYWERPVALMLGSKAAVDYALEVGMDWIHTRSHQLAAHTRELLANLPGVRVLDLGAERCAIVTAHAGHWRPKPLLEHLWANRINCRAGGLTVAQMDFPKKGVDWVLRVSPHYYNTNAEIEQAVAAIAAFKQE